MASASPTQRTLAALRKRGWTAEVVEKWIPQTQRRKDLFGFGDVFAFQGDWTLIVQATSTSNTSSRLAKILESQIALAWVSTHRRELAIVGWKKYKKRKGNKLWRPTWQFLRKEDWGPQEKPAKAGVS